MAWVKKFEWKKANRWSTNRRWNITINCNFKNEYYEKLKAKQGKLKFKIKVYDRYSDDQDFAFRSFEKRVRFSEESDKND